MLARISGPAAVITLLNISVLTSCLARVFLACVVAYKPSICCVSLLTALTYRLHTPGLFIIRCDCAFRRHHALLSIFHILPYILENITII